MARILLFGINYFPEETGIAPYTTELAEHLQDIGNSVTVVTGMPHYPAWRIPAAYRGALGRTESIGGVRVIRRWHYVPRRQSAFRRALYETTFVASGLLSLAPHPEIVLGVVPSLGGGVLARLHAMRYRVPYGVIFQDLMGPAAAQSGIVGGLGVARATARMERWVARGAAAVAIVSDAFRPYLLGAEVVERRLIRLPNWTRVAAASSDRTSTRRRLGWSDNEQIVLHAGNMGLKQGLEQVIKAAQEAQAATQPVRFVLMGDGNQRAALEAAAHDVPTVILLPLQPERDVPDILAAADVLLVNQKPSVIDMSLPSKLTSYFTAGRPVVAAVPPQSATANEIERSGAGLVVRADDTASLLAALARLRDDRPMRERLGACGMEYARTALSRDAAFRAADQFIAMARRTELNRESAARP